ncbi:mitochondrial translation release factor in rescue-like isoform X2 [Ostrea edulis]|nr:mitochondrial translation release factor in rescue-like isoform X2 [Ostrea edulis]XP_048745192.2 mitochondrial translation release factor in rescue-like isoform X2 [Ostrea edulis]
MKTLLRLSTGRWICHFPAVKCDMIRFLHLLLRNGTPQGKLSDTIPSVPSPKVHIHQMVHSNFHVYAPILKPSSMKFKDGVGHVQSSMSISKKSYVFPEIEEADLEEDIVKGSGPGGQAVNKTSNCVILKHRPTGIVVKCHATRSLTKNQELARELLQEKLDDLLNGDHSYSSQVIREKRDKKLKAKQKSKKKYQLLKANKQFCDSPEKEIVDSDFDTDISKQK